MHVHLPAIYAYADTNFDSHFHPQTDAYTKVSANAEDSPHSAAAPDNAIVEHACLSEQVL